MKTFTNLFAATLVCCLIAGCSNKPETPPPADGTSGAAGTTNVSATGLEKDLCAKCGCCAKCDDCCKGEKCEKCGMQAGSELCCSGIKPADDGVYCKACGNLKTETCCVKDAAKCEKCGLAKGSTLCCKVKAHDHEEGDDHDHEDGDDHDAEGDDADHADEAK